MVASSQLLRYLATLYTGFCSTSRLLPPHRTAQPIKKGPQQTWCDRMQTDGIVDMMCGTA